MGASNGNELVLAVGAPLMGTLESGSKLMRKQNSVREPGGLNRSWTRPLGAGELPYAGHLPTLGLLKKKQKGQTIDGEVEDLDESAQPLLMMGNHIQRYQQQQQKE